MRLFYSEDGTWWGGDWALHAVLMSYLSLWARIMTAVSIVPSAHITIHLCHWWADLMFEVVIFWKLSLKPRLSDIHTSAWRSNLWPSKCNVHCSCCSLHRLLKVTIRLFKLFIDSWVGLVISCSSCWAPWFNHSFKQICRLDSFTIPPIWLSASLWLSGRAANVDLRDGSSLDELSSNTPQHNSGIRCPELNWCHSYKVVKSSQRWHSFLTIQIFPFIS